MATRAGIWIRVSTGGQDEANQLPDIERYCQIHDYDIVERYELNDRSAFLGQQQSKLDEMLADVRTGKIRVLVCWHSDRLERRGVEALFKLLREVREAGGKIESVQEPSLGETDVGSVATTALSGIIANAESAKKSAAILLSRNRIKDGGGLWGRANWGYEITGDKYNKTLTPTENGKRYVREVFQRIADGQTCKEVAAWLGAGPRPGVSHKTILRMIRNRTYMGVRMDGQGRPETKATRLVDAKLWLAANKRLDNGGRGKRGPAKGKPALLTSALFCARCRKPDGNAAPMYRIHPPGRGYWYRCHGYEPENKGCGNIVPLESLDTGVIALLSEAPEPWPELRKIPGVNYDTEIAEIKLQLADLPKQGLSREDEQTERERLWADEDRYTELNKHARPDHWDDVFFCATCGGSVYTEDCNAAEHRKVTIGQHFKSLDYDGRRKMIVGDVKIYVGRAYGKVDEIDPVPVPVHIESRLFKLPVALQATAPHNMP